VAACNRTDHREFFSTLTHLELADPAPLHESGLLDPETVDPSSQCYRY